MIEIKLENGKIINTEKYGLNDLSKFQGTLTGMLFEDEIYLASLYDYIVIFAAYTTLIKCYDYSLEDIVKNENLFRKGLDKYLDKCGVDSTNFYFMSREIVDYEKELRLSRKRDNLNILLEKAINFIDTIEKIMKDVDPKNLEGLSKIGDKIKSEDRKSLLMDLAKIIGKK